jgi:hypothetical protein
MYVRRRTYTMTTRKVTARSINFGYALQKRVIRVIE